ncbi:MAG: UvrD-helicase domain-containing protein [Actinomycetia bacterium]|nr:UvrD-helicase domain-containing protein [Actinomycetes bacterium]
MDTVNRQVEFRREERNLKEIVSSIDVTIEYRERRGPVQAADGKAANIVQDLLDAGLEDVRSARSRPYFGRIDYSTGLDGDVETVYIGDVNIRSEDPRYSIASRNAPIAGLYYRPVDGFYDVGGGRIEASVHLKRTLTIEDARLVDFDDVLGLPPGPGLVRSTSSRVLDEKLSAVGSSELADAVQTIQPDQYEQIASIQKPVLIVQGAAGSGKSLIGLHRIDFILSPFSNIGSLRRPTAERVIMFGPSPAFLKYASALLPGLGVHGVRQMTVSDWLLGQFSSRVRLSRGDRIFEDLMNNRRKLTEAEIEAHLFKTGLKMKRLIDNYVSHLGREIRARASRAPEFSIPGPPDASPMDVGPSALTSLVKSAFETHPEPNAARRYLVNTLAGEWARANRRSGVRPSEAIAEGSRLVESSLGSLWERVDFRSEYASLVSSPEKIMAYSRKGDVDSSGAGEVAETAPSGMGQALGITDLAAALYFDYRLNGFESERFEHVVVDEAQDVSPLEISLMQMHSSNDSFTVLGDLRQSVLPYKSISNWNQIASLFERENVSRLDSRLTYRSTRQITQYANRILQGLPERTKAPVPYDRSGERPRLVRSKSTEEMKESIADTIRRLTNMGDGSSVAVLTKRRRTADDIGESLRQGGIENIGILTRGGMIETDVTVSPIVLTKGLEFDAVIIANVHKGNFNESDFDRTLLYLACTRARHHLEIHWYGTRSSIAPDVIRLAR